MIYIDTSEVPSEIWNLLDGMGAKYKLGRLKFGDFIITGRNGEVMIERKTPEDYIGSLISGHLSDQLTRMSEMFDHSFVLVEGSVSAALAEGGITRKTFFSSLVGSAMKRAERGKKGAVSILMVSDNWDTAMLLERIQHRLDDPKGLVRTPYIGAPQVAGKDPQVSALCAIPLVGETIARDILKVLLTVENVAKAPISRLKEIKNVGDGIATNIYNFFREPYKGEKNA